MTQFFFLLEITDFGLFVRNKDGSNAAYFRTLANGTCNIHTSVQQKVKIQQRASTVIFLPFTIHHQMITFSSMIHSKDVVMPAGNYRLLFEVIPKEEAEKRDTYHFIFIPIARGG